MGESHPLALSDPDVSPDPVHATFMSDATGEDWEAFISRETDKYRPQLLAYREMAAKAKGIDPPEAIRVGIYFTACRKVVEV